jgi:plastocyanin
MLNDLWTRLISWTGGIVSPDWAALVALIPVLLLVVVVAFLVISAAKWANAGPTRRGPERRQPLAPDGTPIRGPSVAPLVVAAGAFVLAFGLVGGGPWLPLGFVVSAIGLAWWTLEFRRDVRPQPTARPTATMTMTSADAGNADAGAATRRTPVRPAALGLGWSLALLAAGLVLGGIVLGLGVVAVLGSAAWWARDTFAAPRPSGSSASADTAAAATRATTARPRATPVRIALVGVVIVGIALVAATSRVVPDAPGASPSAVPPVPSGADQATLPPADAALAAENVMFVPTTLTAPAGRPFTVAFDNRDKVPHNLEVRDSAGKPLFLGDIVIGPKIVVYNLPSLPAGQYPFLCTVHPVMTGTLTVK